MEIYHDMLFSLSNASLSPPPPFIPPGHRFLTTPKVRLNKSIQPAPKFTNSLKGLKCGTFLIKLIDNVQFKSQFGGVRTVRHFPTTVW